MSKLLFWSPYHGQGQTCNLHVIALIMGLLYKKSVLMMQTHFRNNNLEGPLVGCNVDTEGEGDAIFQEIGLDMAVTYSRMNKINTRTLTSCCLTFPDTPMLLLPGTQAVCKETFDRDIAKEVYRLVREADECVDFVLIDSNSGRDRLSMELMEGADLIIVNMTQRKHVIHKFFHEYGESFLKSAKVFYLFGDYDDNSSYNINNCRRKYSRYLNRSNSGVIPYCTKLMDAQSESSMLQFMKRGLRTGPETYAQSNREYGWRRNRRLFLPGPRYHPEETDYFFHRSRLSTDKIIGLLQLPLKRKQEDDMNEFL